MVRIVRVQPPNSRRRAAYQRHGAAKTRGTARYRGPSLSMMCCGGVLLSHNLSVAVPLALPGLASRFGMEAGRFPGAMTTTSVGVQHAPPRAVLLVGGVG